MDVPGEAQASGILLTVGRSVAHPVVSNAQELRAAVAGVLELAAGAASGVVQ